MSMHSPFFMPSNMKNMHIHENFVHLFCVKSKNLYLCTAFKKMCKNKNNIHIIIIYG